MGSKAEWVVGLILGAGLLWFLLGRDADQDAGSVEQASAAEVMECKERIESEFPEAKRVGTSLLAGKSSDKLGPGGTSRVKLYFEVEAMDGKITPYQGVCQFADGAPPLIVQAR